ncbi:HTH-type transcriptional regulator YesS [Paenibacillus solanacearum]|uniref:HTH-type transcriptional regulator YesS n=2 Tax=Paenibacillus solanacearum TaxID=2048548 RepID=A0A916JT63_9BACL|nr:HTH-type transcriptional regulator YesS [Paenibacillus solanacearum]
MRRSTYFHKLIVYAICLITFPMVTLGVFSYLLSSRTVQQKVNDGALQMLLQMQQRVEQSLRTADNALTQFTVQPSVLRLLTEDVTDGSRSDNAALIDGLQEGLRGIQLSDLRVADVQFIQLRDRWKMSGGGYEPFGPLEPDWKQMYGDRPGSYWTISSRTIDFVRTLPISSPEPTAMIMFRVPYGELRKYMFTHPELGEPFIIDDSLRVVAHTDHWTRVGTSAASMPYARQLLDSESDSGLFKTQLDGEPYNVIYSKSAYNGWMYVSLVSVTAMTRESETIKWVTVAAGAVFLLIGAAVSLLGARRLYGPVRKLYESVFQPANGEAGSGGDIPASGKDELQLIGERVQAQLHNQKEMSRELKSQRSRLQHFFLLKLYLGQTDGSERAPYEAEASRQWKAMSVLVLQIDSLENTGYAEQDKELLLFAVTNIIAEIVPQHERLLEPIVMGQSQVTLVGSPLADEQAYSAWLDGAAKLIRETVKQYLRLPVSIGVSSPFRSLSEAGRGYKEAGEALQYRIKLGLEAVVHIGDVQPDRSLVPEYPEKVKSELIEAVRMCEGERAYGLLEQFTRELFAAPLSHRQYQMLMIALLTDLLRVLQEYEGVLQSLYEEEKSLYDKLFELKTSAEMTEWLYQSVLMPAIRLMEERKNKQHRGITDELLRMIENEYDSPLTIESCAFRIHYHPDYVRHVFRKEMGMPFSDYLAQFRLQMAKSWLTGTDMRIADIAEKLQYTNAQNFIRYFRKMEGMTPGQYRDSRGAGAQGSL